MIRSFRSTLLTLASRGYLLGGLGTMAGLTFLSVMINVGDAEPTVDERGPLGESVTMAQLDSAEGLAVAMGGTIALIGMVVLAIHASVIASDYANGTIRNLLVRQPNRLRLLAGKSLALVVATTGAVAVTVVVGTATAVAFAPAGADTSLWFGGDGLAELGRTTLNVSLAALGWGLFGQVLAVASRSAVVSLATGVLVAIPLDMTISDTAEGAKRWLPGQILQSISRGGTTDVDYAPALVTAGVAVAVAAAASAVLFQRRDVVA